MIRPQDHVHEIVDAATLGSCAKDQRAAALVTDLGSEGSLLLAVAPNGPPLGFRCARDHACAATCGKSAVHAEMRALLMVAPAGRKGAEMIHARIDRAGVLQTSRTPRCADCSKHMLDAGVAALWLYHREGWKRYPMREAHKMSAAAREIHTVPVFDRYLRKPEVTTIESRRAADMEP